jgi:hypothetical protein
MTRRKDTALAIVKALAKVQGRAEKEYQQPFGMAPMLWDEDAAWRCLCRARAYLKGRKK